MLSKARVTVMWRVPASPSCSALQVAVMRGYNYWSHFANGTEGGTASSNKGNIHFEAMLKGMVYASLDVCWCCYFRIFFFSLIYVWSKNITFIWIQNGYFHHARTFMHITTTRCVLASLYLIYWYASGCWFDIFLLFVANPFIFFNSHHFGTILKVNIIPDDC